MFCPNCGKEIKPDDLFCTSCGTKLDFLQQVAQEQPDLLEEALQETPEQETWQEDTPQEGPQETQPVQQEPEWQQEPDDQNEYPEEYADEYQNEYQDNYQDDGYYQEDYQDYTAPPRKRLPIWALILIIVGGVLVTAAIVIALFFFILKPRIQGPDLPTEIRTEEVTTTEVPTETTTKSDTSKETTTQATYPKKKWATAKDGLLLREGPGKQYNAIYLILQGTELTIDKEENNWAHTTIAGLTGWCSCDYLTDTPPEIPQQTTAASTDPNTLVYPDPWIDYGYHGYVNTQDGLMFRLGPGTNYNAIDVIPYGTEVAEEGWYGDWIFVKYNGRYGWVNSKYITASGGMAKPAIYLYPETSQVVSVDVELSEGNFTRTAPLYHNGWNVLAAPNGTLTDLATGETYDYIFWESDSEPAYDWSEGYVVAGKDTRAFLLDILPKMGLIPSEYLEFINYWQPRMQKNAYNLITFQEECYTDAAKLKIDPQPDSCLRIFMAYKAIDTPIDIPAPKITPFERKGFTVVEWGGAEVQ
ncbi:MAG: SH3 domain-containing protein [Lachnospiraceae bacterium]|nr:SH3 domain-containing protein [Lachnospiraceae bacterium]